MLLGLIILIGKLLETLKFLAVLVPILLCAGFIITSIVLFVKNSKRKKQGKKSKSAAPIIFLILGCLSFIPIILIAIYKILINIVLY